MQAVTTVLSGSNEDDEEDRTIEDKISEEIQKKRQTAECFNDCVYRHT